MAKYFITLSESRDLRRRIIETAGILREHGATETARLLFAAAESIGDLLSRVDDLSDLVAADMETAKDQ